MKKDKQYKLTQSQVNKLYNTFSWFDTICDMLGEVCSSEKPDINYGFELGKLHSLVKDYHYSSKEFYEEITDSQNI